MNTNRLIDAIFEKAAGSWWDDMINRLFGKKYEGRGTPQPAPAKPYSPSVVYKPPTSKQITSGR